MAGNTKKSTPKKKELSTRRGGSSGSQQYVSPTARAIVSRHTDGEITTKEAIDLLGGKGKSAEVRKGLARALGSQNAEIDIAGIRQEVKARRSPKTQTRKPGFAKGGMVKKANCGASMKPTQRKK
tara:strand:- start:311 stop:685 length:375 start_codon:yes stop_codon:yes gene_type:complete